MSDFDNRSAAVKPRQATITSLPTLQPMSILNALFHALFACLAWLVLIIRSVPIGIVLITILLLDLGIEGYFLRRQQRYADNKQALSRLTLRVLIILTLLGTVTGSTAGLIIRQSQPVLRLSTGAIIVTPQPSRIRVDPAHLHADGGLAFSADGLRIALGISTGVEIWNQQTDTLSAQYAVPFSNDSAIAALALGWSPNDTAIAITFSHIPKGKTTAATEYTLIVWNAATGAIEINQSLPRPLTYLVWSPDGKTLSGYLPPQSSNGIGVIELWDIATKQARAPIFLQGVPALTHQYGSDPVFSWSPDSTRMIIINKQQYILMIDMTVVDVIAHFTDPTPVLALAWSPDGKTIVTGHADGTITFWDAASLTATQSIMTRPAALLHLLWQRDSKRLLSATPTAISVIDTELLRTTAILQHNSSVPPVMTPTGITSTGTPIDAPQIVAIDISFNGSQIGALYSDGSLFLWNAKDIRQ